VVVEVVFANDNRYK